MSQAVGIDIVRVSRFEKWCSFSERSLKRVFHEKEVERLKEILSSNIPEKLKLQRASQFLASRFAVKEAFYKVLCSIENEEKIEIPDFLHLCKNVYVKKGPRGEPLLSHSLNLPQKMVFSISVAHETCCAVAIVIY
ncbi:holo-ACP synthase [Candidatus Dependentiae bacterium]